MLEKKGDSNPPPRLDSKEQAVDCAALAFRFPPCWLASDY